MKILPVLIAVSIGACGMPPRDASYVNDMPGESALLLEGVVGSLEESANDSFMHARKGDIEIRIGVGELEPGTLGQAAVGQDECDITIIPGMIPEGEDPSLEEDLRHVLLHEIGHCFGLEHSDDPSDIMYFEYRPMFQQNPESYERFTKQLDLVRGRRR